MECARVKNNPVKILITIGAFAAFFLFGFLDNLKGPVIPFVIKELKINYALMSIVLFLEYAAFLAATIMAGVCIFRFGLKTVLLAALVLLFLGLAVPAGIPVYWVLSAAFLALGLGLGTLEITCNSTIVLLHSENKGKLLNLLGSFHGVGSMLAPLYAGALLSTHISWRIAFAICLIPILILLLYLTLIKFPKPGPDNAEGLFALAKSAFSREMIWHYIAICFYVAVEIGLATWIVEYTYKIKGQSFFYSTISLSVFFGLITGGRLLGGFFVDKIGHLRILFLAATGALVSLMTGIYGPDYLAVFLPFTGLFFSIIFPTITASFTDIQKPEIGKYLGFLFTFAGIGGMIGPWLIGVFGDLIQLTNSISILIGYALIMFTAIVVLLFLKNGPKKTEDLNRI